MAPMRKTYLAPCGFDPEEFHPVDRMEARRLLRLDPFERWIVYVGRVVPRKGIDTAIEGFARLVQRHGIAARMLIVGGEADEPDPLRTPEIGRLVDIARRAGVSDRVTFTGRRGRNVLRYYYSAADVFVTTPWYEPFGITSVEAMACGTPVIGTAVGGIQHTVRHGRTGFLVPAKDPNALARQLATFYYGPEVREHMSKASLARVNRLFTWQRVATQIAAVYQKVLATRRATATAAVPDPMIGSEYVVSGNEYTLPFAQAGEGSAFST